MKRAVIFIIFLIGLYSCATQKKLVGKQGIVGEVRWVEGNLMPTIGDSNYEQRAEGIPLERDIYIFFAVKRDETVSAGGAFYKSINSVLAAKVKSDRNGQFKADLPPGKYSVFVMEKDGYFANIFDGDNYINPVAVHDNEYAAIKIMVNYKAFY